MNKQFKKICISLVCIIAIAGIGSIRSMKKSDNRNPYLIKTFPAKITEYSTPTVTWGANNMFAINNPYLTIFKIENGKIKQCDSNLRNPENILQFNHKGDYLVWANKYNGTKITKVNTRTGKIKQKKYPPIPITGTDVPSTLNPQNCTWHPKLNDFVVTKYPTIYYFTLKAAPKSQYTNLSFDIFDKKSAKNIPGVGIKTIKFSSDGKSLAYIGENSNKVVIMDNSFNTIKEFSLKNLQNILVPIPKKDDFIIVEYAKNISTIKQIKIKSNKVKIIAKIKGKINNIDIAPEGNIIAFAVDNTIQFLNAKSGKKIGQQYALVADKKDIIQSVKFSKNGKYISSIGETKIQIWKNPLNKEASSIRKEDLLKRIQYVLELE